MSTEEIKAVLHLASIADVDGAQDALEKFEELTEEVAEIEAAIKDIRKSLKRIKKALD